MHNYHDRRSDVLKQALDDLGNILSIHLPQAGNEFAMVMERVEEDFVGLEQEYHRDILAGAGPVATIVRRLGIDKGGFPNLLERHPEEERLAAVDIEQLLRHHVSTLHTPYGEGGLLRLPDDFPMDDYNPEQSYQSGIFRWDSKWMVVSLCFPEKEAVHVVEIPLKLGGFSSVKLQPGIRTYHYAEDADFSHTEYGILAKHAFEEKFFQILESRLGYTPPPAFSEHVLIEAIEAHLAELRETGVTQVRDVFPTTTRDHYRLEVMIPQVGRPYLKVVRHYHGNYNWGSHNEIHWDELPAVKQHEFVAAYFPDGLPD